MNSIFEIFEFLKSYLNSLSVCHCFTLHALIILFSWCPIVPLVYQHSKLDNGRKKRGETNREGTKLEGQTGEGKTAEGKIQGRDRTGNLCIDFKFREYKLKEGM